MKVPPKRKGNTPLLLYIENVLEASMKVPPKRKGNGSTRAVANRGHVCLNESPSEKEGKFRRGDLYYESLKASMKVPPKRKGNCSLLNGSTAQAAASMKVPPKRKGNFRGEFRGVLRIVRLNESPSEKEGKFECVVLDGEADGASMKVPPKRKGNDVTMTEGGNLTPPQ